MVERCSWKAATLVFAAMFRLAAGDDAGTGWRNDGTGHFPAARPPVQWSAQENIAWKTELPGRSLASPIVVAERMFVLAEPTDLVCLNTADGAIAWQKSHAYSDVFPPEKAAAIEADLAKAREIQQEIEQLHRQRREAEKAGDEELKESFEPKIQALEAARNKLTEIYRQLPGGDAANTGCTPTSDGENVFALFGTGVVSSHSLSGKRNWMTFIEGSTGDQSASPVWAEGKLIVQLRQLHALDANTGELLWTAKVDQRHGSPVVGLVGDTHVVVTPNGAVIRLADGAILARDLFRLGHSSPIVHDGVVYAMEDGATKAIKLSAEPDGSETLWESEGSRTNRLASPLYHDGLLYCVNEQGVLEVNDGKTGNRLYRKRLAFSGGRLDPSLCLAGNRLYITSNQGMTIVLKPGREYEELAQNELREEFSSSPVFAGERVYFRTRKFAICIGE
jgi:outer membrane protein assembly factor BamB